MNDENLLKYFKHFNHPFYKKVDQITDEVKEMQIRKGAEKYPEPFTPSSWTGKKLAIHALQELRDGQVYVVGLLERIEELEEALEFYADEENWTEPSRQQVMMDGEPDIVDGPPWAIEGSGEKARHILERKHDH